MSQTSSLALTRNLTLKIFLALKLVLGSNGNAIAAMLAVKLNVSQPKGTDIAAHVTHIETATTEAITKQAETWGTLLKRLEIVVKLGDQLAEVSPCLYPDIRSNLAERPSASSIR